MTKCIIFTTILFWFLLGFSTDLSAKYFQVDTVQKNQRTLKFRVDEPPIFQAGTIDNFVKYIRKKINYPFGTFFKKHNKIVVVQFIVDKKGHVKNVVLIQSSGYDNLDKEIVKAFIKSDVWIPAKDDGVTVDKQLELKLKIR